MQLILAIILTLAAAGTACAQEQGRSASPGYTVGIGDVLSIEILHPDQLSQVVTVSPDGSITFPYVNSLSVKGKTLEDIQSEIREGLAKGFMKYPVVSVSLRESHSRKFFVYGDIAHPGEYPFEENMTVLRGVSMAGGFSKDTMSSRVKVLRARRNAPGYETIPVNVKKLMAGEEGADPQLLAGDTVVISESTFFVYGEVARPGVYPLAEGITAVKAISMAGGFTKFGSSSKVKVLRQNETGTGYETLRINIKAVVDGISEEDVALAPGDTVVVSEGVF